MCVIGIPVLLIWVAPGLLASGTPQFMFAMRNHRILPFLSRTSRYVRSTHKVKDATDPQQLLHILVCWLKNTAI